MSFVISAAACHLLHNVPTPMFWVLHQNSSNDFEPTLIVDMAAAKIVVASSLSFTALSLSKLAPIFCLYTKLDTTSQSKKQNPIDMCKSNICLSFSSKLSYSCHFLSLFVVKRMKINPLYSVSCYRHAQIEVALGLIL